MKIKIQTTSLSISAFFFILLIIAASCKHVPKTMKAYKYEFVAGEKSKKAKLSYEELYNDDGKIQDEIEYGGDGKIVTSKTIYKYDMKKKLVEVSRYDIIDSLTAKLVHKKIISYTQEGKKDSILIYDDIGNYEVPMEHLALTAYMKYSYDSMNPHRVITRKYCGAIDFFGNELVVVAEKKIVGEDQWHYDIEDTFVATSFYSNHKCDSVEVQCNKCAVEWEAFTHVDTSSQTKPNTFHFHSYLKPKCLLTYEYDSHDSLVRIRKIPSTLSYEVCDFSEINFTRSNGKLSAEKKIGIIHQLVENKNITEEVIKKYNEQHQLIEESAFKNDKQLWKNVYSYDKHELKEMTSFDNYNEPIQTTVFEYK